MPMERPKLPPRETFINSPELKAFIQGFKRIEEPKLEELYYKLGHSNHEVWRHCIPCKEHWDAKKELSGVLCPKCGRPGDVG